MQKEQRKYVRKQILSNIVVEFKAKASAVTYNISQGGISFILPADKLIMEVGDVCKIHLKMHSDVIKLKGTIKRLKHTDESKEMFNYGVEFQKPLAVDQFNFYLSNFI